MDRILTLKVILIAKFLTILSTTDADTYSVKIGTESHVNLVDSKFLSFTIDPKYLFSSSGKYNSKECICMASSLTPAYIRIAGPSTSHMTFNNATISIDALQLLDDDNSPQKISLNEYQRVGAKMEAVSVTPEEWETFVHWAKKTGFDLVFALNNEEKTSSGMWDPNTALRILTVADKANIGDIFWQLGFECNNQSIEEYLNDLETLRVITETFPSGKAGHWRVVGGDVTPCLAADSKSDFKDYVALSDEMFDAVFLNGNSSSQELERMSEKDRLKLLKVLSRSETPLWLTESTSRQHELQRAADWMTSLGHSARNGFAVHFRELLEVELYEPTLSFYMALLFKNLVGERVLNVDIEASEATMFAHCTSLRHKPVPGAVTLYGANMDTEPARFSIKLSKKEEGGDIMQFILGHDHNGNIVVNGRAMYYEGDIKPVVKRVRPYKTLLINLPPKSFGFWVLANTQVDACYDIDDKPQKERTYVEALSVESGEDSYSSIMKSKRSILRNDIDIESSTDFVTSLNGTDAKETSLTNKALETRINNLNNELVNVKTLFSAKEHDNKDETHPKKVKRQVDDDGLVGTLKRNLRRHGLKLRNSISRNYDQVLGSSIISKLKNSKLGRKSRLGLSRVSKRNSKGLKSSKSKKSSLLENKNKESNTGKRKTASEKIVSNTEITNPDCDTLRKRKRRSIDEINMKVNDMSNESINENKGRKFRYTKNNPIDDDIEEETSENVIDKDNEPILPVGKILHKVKKISRFPLEIRGKHEHNLDDYYDDTSDMEEIVLKTKILDDSALINIAEKSKNGFLRSTVEEILTVLSDLNKNLNKVWSALTFLE